MGFSNYRPVQTLLFSREAGQGQSLPCSTVAARPTREVGLASLTSTGPVPDRTPLDFLFSPTQEKTKNKIVDLNSNIMIITLNTIGLSIPIKR